MRKKKRLKKTSLALLAAMVLAGGGVTVYAAEEFSLTMMPTINTTKDSPAYTKSISTTYAHAKIKSATYNSGKITLQVYKKSNNKEVTGSNTISISDRTSHKLKYSGNYGKQSFSAFLRAKHSATQGCPPYAYVTISWNPNG